MNYFHRSWILTSALLRTLLQHKRIAILPLILLILRLGLYFIGLLILYFKFPGIEKHQQDFFKEFNHWYYWVMLIAAYFYLNFMAILFNAATIAYVTKLFKKESCSVFEAFKLAWSRCIYVIEWIIFYPTIGIFIGFFASIMDWIDKIVVKAFYSSWQPIRWLSISMLVFNDKCLIKNMRNSGKLLAHKWGGPVNRISNYGAVLFLCLLPVFIIGTWIGFSDINFKLKAGIIVTLFIYISLLHVLSAILANIFQAVIYVYLSSGKVPDGFQKNILDQLASV